MIRKSSLRYLLLLLFAVPAVDACRHLPAEVDMPDGGYPEDVNRIVMLHCTTGATGGGCHNAIGAPNSGGLRMDTWDALFNGASNGAAVVPFDTINSTLLHYVNVDTTLGSVAVPNMPFNGTPISREEYLTLRNWIARGAPDKNGVIPFADNPDTRQKMYLLNQASDMLSVIDANRQVIMRNVPLGVSRSVESPHCVRFSPDGQYAYVCFLAGDYIQKIDTRQDKVVDQVKISNGDAQWNVLHVSRDGKKLIVSDLANGWIRIINTATMQITLNVGSSASPMTPFVKPHGIEATPNFDTFYMTGQYGNTVFKFTPDFLYLKYVTIDVANGVPKPKQYNAGTLDPHEIQLTPDGSRYFLTCEASAEIRVMDARADTLIAVIPTGTKPQEIAISRTKPYIFFTLMEANNTLPGSRGAVMVVNYQTLEVVKTIYGPFWQPHGICVDDANGTFYVASTNIGGPFTGHNHTNSTGSVGWYNVYDLNTLELVRNRSYEALSQPYSLDSRIKP